MDRSTPARIRDALPADASRTHHVGNPPTRDTREIGTVVEVRPAEAKDERSEAPASGPPEVAPGWTEPAPDRPVPFWTSLRQDLHAHLPEGRRGSLALRVARQTLVVARSSGLHMTLLHRVAHQAHHRLGLPGRVAAGIIFWVLRHAYTCSIASTARIYGGLILPHPQNIVIGPDSVIGPRAWIYQNVTVGGGVPGKAGMPRIGRDARLYTGAVVVGPIVVGDNVLVGANAVVGSDVPSYRAVRSPLADVAPLPDRYVVHQSWSHRRRARVSLSIRCPRPRAPGQADPPRRANPIPGADRSQLALLLNPGTNV